MYMLSYKTRFGYLHPREQKPHGLCIGDLFENAGYAGKCLGVLGITTAGQIMLIDEGSFWPVGFAPIAQREFSATKDFLPAIQANYPTKDFDYDTRSCLNPPQAY